MIIRLWRMEEWLCHFCSGSSCSFTKISTKSWITTWLPRTKTRL